ncbi:MAG: HTH domain-containing protein [Candidatus Thorarchaeota archaeon]|nr:HTH domain-containing protein [Candidatus Thorarchaeota archaeon]
MTQRLTGKYLTLLIALHESPMARIEQLAERVGLSRTTVSRDLKFLSGNLPSSTRKFFRVVPELDETALGLMTIDVFLETSQLASIERLEKMCDTHPYTKYRARCFGSHSGLFVQFRVPANTGQEVKMLLSSLCTAKLVDDYAILPTESAPPVFSVSKLEHWDSASFTWAFDWKRWASKRFRKEVKHKASKKSLVNMLDSRDISILTQLAYGSRRKQKDIIKALSKEGIKITTQDFSRRLAILNEHFIRGYMVFLDTDAFDLYSNVLLTAKCSPDFARALEERMRKAPIPFQSTLKVQDDFLWWFLRLPPSHLSSILSYLQSEVDRLSLSILDYMSSEVYGVWAGAFLDEKNNWNCNKEFMVSNPLESLL